MKKALSLILAAMMLLALLAGCGADNGQTPNTDDQQQSADNQQNEQQNENQNPEEPSTTFEGILDKTEDYNIVIETPGTTGNERIGVRAAAGKVEIGQYNKLGSKRTDALEFDWSELGLEGEAWEYLGATFIFDISGEKPVLTNKPEKCCYVVPVGDIKLGEDAVTLPNGVEFKYAYLNNGIMRPNSLINEGGKYVMGWNDLSVDADFFDNTTGYYVFLNCEKYNQSIVVSAQMLPGEAIAPEDTDPDGVFTGALDMTDSYTLVIETPGSSGDDRIGVLADAGMVEIGRYKRDGMERTGSLKLAWADLGLEGEAWEYLGATFEFDTTGATPVLTNKPEKSCFAIALADVVQDGENLTLPNGKVLPLTDLNYGRLRANNMLNEGGKFASGWNDHSVKASYFDVDDGQTGGYLVCICEKYDASIICKAAELPQ